MAGWYRDLKFIEVSPPSYMRDIHCQKELGRIDGSRTLASGTSSEIDG